MTVVEGRETKKEKVRDGKSNMKGDGNAREKKNI